MTNRIDVGTLPEAARRAVLEVALSMAWADSRIDRSELGALEGASKALELSLSEDELYAIVDRGAMPIEKLDLAVLSGAAAELAYLTAAWMAQVDESAASEETARLRLIGDRLGIDDGTAGRMRKVAGSVRDSFDRSRAWWEEYKALLNLEV